MENHKCIKCGHEWVPRTSKVPKKCPKCWSAGWQGEIRQAPEKRVRSTLGLQVQRAERKAEIAVFLLTEIGLALQAATQIEGKVMVEATFAEWADRQIRKYLEI